MQIMIYPCMFLSGIIAGWALLKIINYLIAQRSHTKDGHWLVNDKRSIVFWIVFNAFAWLEFVLIFGISLKAAQCIFIFTVCVVISVIDILIKKIPNEMIVLIMLTSMAFMFLDWPAFSVKDNILGLAVGFGLFCLPFFLKRQAGAGDLKYAAAIGFSLGAYYSLIAFLIMSLVFLIYALSLMIKKGSLKTKVAMGPYLSLGFILAFIVK